MKDYLEDLLAEPLREEMGDHLGQCISCRNYMLGFGTFASDLRRLAWADVPFDLAGGLKKHLENSGIKTGDSHFFYYLSPKKVTVTCFLALLLFAAAWGVKTLRDKSEPPAPIVVPPYASVAVQELQNIDQRLARVTESAAPKLASIQGITLRPFHWHLVFETLEARDAFSGQIASIVSKASFQIPECLVLDTNRKELEKIIFLIENSSGLKWEGKKVQIEKIPPFEGPLRVSLILKAPPYGQPPGRFLHWHFHFSLPNRFLFLESLKEKKIQFLYEAPELWLLWAAPEEFLKLKDEIRSFHGLSLEYLDDDSRIEGIAVWGGARIVIYIQEG